MSYPVSETWIVSGVLFDNGVPFNQGKLEAYNRLANGDLQWMAECGIDVDGSFSLEFSASMFQHDDLTIDHPNLVVRLFDYDDNLLWESDTYAAMETPFGLGNVDISMASADDTWNLEGFVYYNTTTPLSAGNVFVYDIWNGQSTLLVQSSLNTKGYFSCSYLKSAFQKQGSTRNAPNLQIIVRDLQGKSLATYDVPNPVSVHQVVQIPLGIVPDVLTNDDCKVFGNVKNTLGYPLQDNISVAAFCLYYKESINSNGSKSGTFEKVMLGNPTSPDAFGNYEIIYNASVIPLGLKLDSKIAKGKDKASVFAEVHYSQGGTNENSGLPRSFYSAPLVFNGQSIQEINFVLDLETDKPVKSEFETLNDILKIYYQTVVDYRETIKIYAQDKISEFLSSNIQFPLVIGRENIEQAKARAYFKAFQLAHELIDSVEGLRGEFNPKPFPSQDEMYEIVFSVAEYLYPLILNANVVDVSTFLAMGLDECIKEIQKAVVENTISSSCLVEEFKTKIWVHLQKSENVATEQEDTFSAFFIFYLYFAKELELEESDSTIPDSLKKKGRRGRPKLASLQSVDNRLESLLEEFVESGSNYRDLINNQANTHSILSAAEIEDLKFLIDLGDFCNWYSDLVVSIYTLLHEDGTSYKPCVKPDEDVTEGDELGAWKLEYLLKYDNQPVDFTTSASAQLQEPIVHNFWEEVINETAERYSRWCHNVALALPLDQFVGTTALEQKQIAVRTLKSRLKEKFPQKNLTNVLTERFPIIPNPYSDIPEENLTEEQIREVNEINERNAWPNLIAKLANDAAWANFDLNSSDLELFLKASADAHELDSDIPKAEASEDEVDKIKTLQRLYRLTNDQEAIAYLIKSDFDSAAKIALVDEERFVAEHGLGLGDKELATNIHRLAKNFVANATLDIERYHISLNEADATIMSLPRGFQDAQNSVNMGRGTLNAPALRTTNIAKQRLQNKSYANWKTLFGSINRNSGTQNQSILSASAYLLDLLDFLKQGHAYTRFISRRPDVKKLLMTKANAEISLPTIDLAIELLESLVSKSSVNENAVPLCNQTPDDATVENLRANPCQWDSSATVSDQNIENLAMSALADKCYPMTLPKNFDRERVSAILGDLSLDFDDIARKLHNSTNCSLLLEAKERETLETSRPEHYTTYDLWGLEYYGNKNVFFPDKSKRIENSTYWYDVLCNLAFVLDRAKLTYDEFAEIFSSSVFQNLDAEIKAKAESYQLADVNGYKINFINDNTNAKKIEFFFRLSVFVRRRKLLGWSVEDVARTWTCNVDELADIQELKKRLDLTVLEAKCLLSTENTTNEDQSLNENEGNDDKPVLSREELKKLFPIDSLFELYPESGASAGSAGEYDKLRFQLIAAAEVCLNMNAQDALLILEKFWIPAAFDSMTLAFEDGLKILYKYNLWITKNKLSVEDYLFLDRIGFPVAFGCRTNCNETIDKLELLRSSSLSISDLKSILEPQLIPLAESSSFVVELNANVRKSLDECAVQEKEKPPVIEPENNSQTSNSTNESESEFDYETAIRGLLKTLGKENAEEIFDAWKNDFEPDTDGKWNACLNDLLRFVPEPSSSWKDAFADDENGTLFYNALLEELAFERSLTLIAEKFSMTSDSIVALFEKLKDDDALDDLTEWKNFAIRDNITSINDLNENDVILIKILSNRIVRCSALYQFTQTLDLGFEWDWENLIPPDEKSVSNIGEPEPESENSLYSLFENVLYAFAASSQILGEVYNYSDLENLDASNEKIHISNEAFDAILTASEIDFERDANSLAITSLEMDEPSAWCRFADILGLYRKTNTLPGNLQHILNTDDSLYAEYANILEGNLKLTRTNSEWNKFIQGVNDKIRQLKRDALATVVCNESQMPNTAQYYPVVFVDESDIYSYYLFDVKMEPDMAISRTVQAVSCIQLYVQRALMGLEGGYTLNDTQKEQWEWMKNYQVWVANRKIFLYPENWIDGDLREDKTPFFKDLEDRLAEIGNDQEALTEALGEYLKKVCDTSEIDIVGACKQDGGVHAGTLYTLHIIGCTRGEPHAYYYRTYEATALYGGSWTPWEEVPLEIDGAAIQPAILGGHLHITWLQVIQGQRQKKTGESGGQQTSVSVEYYAELRLKWASFTGTKWTGVKVGKQAVYDVSDDQLNFILGENEKLADRYFVIDVSDNSDTLNLQVWRTFPDFVDSPHVVAVPVANSAPMSGEVECLSQAPATTYILKTEISREYRTEQRINYIGNFTLTQDGSDTASNQVEPDTGNPIAFTYGEFVKNHSPLGCRLVGNMFYNAGGALVLQDGTKIFRNTRGPFRLLSVNMGFVCHVDTPFFYMDSKGAYLIHTVSGDGGAGANSVPNYHVEMISNPQAGEFRRRFLQGGTKWLYSRETEALPVSDSYYYSYSYYNYYFSVYLGYYTAGDWQAWDLSQTLFEHSYLPSRVVAEPYPSSTVDFCWGSATSIYNWELFFFVPMLLADRMLAEQNYEAALNWLQLVFDPRIDLTHYERTKRFVRDLSKGAKYWRFLPFFANQDADKSILSDLSFPTPHDALPDHQAILLLQDRWKNNPFDPQMIARYRPVAYQKYVVMKYLDALIGWGDQLFTQDTTESVNLAIQMYILAAEILGPKSAEVPDPKNDSAFSVQALMAKGMGVMNNAFVTYEDTMLMGKCREKETPQRLLPGNTMQLAHTTGMMFYFNVPRNENLMGYWDTVADRLYKIRNSLNIEGVKRTLALFAPPIDPAMLVKAKANGVSISDALADASSALPYYRFKVMVAKAIEIVRDVQRIGRELMDAIEKFDAESLALLRVAHEKTALTLQRTLTEFDTNELEKELEAVETEEENLQEEIELQKTFFKKSEQEIQYERAMEKVKKVQETVENMKKAASVAYKIPDLGVGAILNGLGGPSFDSISMGGTKIAENLVNAAEGYASQFAQKQIGAALKKVLGEQNRVEQSWEMQKTAKANQIKNVQKKKTTAEIKIDYAKKQLENYEREIELKDEMYEHLSEKYTNKDLYTWLKKETGSVYKTLFQLAAKVAHKAEKCYHFEIGDTDENPKTAKTFIKGCGVYWDGLHGGLLAGEKLLADLHAMEIAYLENDKNELEITRPVSLWELEYRRDQDDLDCFQSPLTKLKRGEDCFFTIPETLFFKDFPDHYFRRIRDVRVEVIAPNYKGHYLNAQLSLTDNWLDLKSGEPVGNRIGTRTMATSVAQKKSGKYDFRFGSDKFHPFEGAGAIDSKWSLTINGYNITGTGENKAGIILNPEDVEDVIVYIRYTARMGKTRLQGGAN